MLRTGQAAGPSAGREATDEAVAAHSRFARAALLIYTAAAAIAVAVLVTSIAADRTYEEAQIRRTLLLETQLRAHYLAQQLGLLENELRRLGLRSEINLLDKDSGPERDLLRRAHERSAFFNVGVAVVDANGAVVWSEPDAFLPRGSSVASDRWFSAVRSSSAVEIVPVDPERAEDAILYVVSPILRDAHFSGALLGAVDLARGWEIGPEVGRQQDVQIVLAARRGSVVYPPRPPSFASEEVWRDLCARGTAAPLVVDAPLGGGIKVVAATPVPDTDLVLVSLAGRDALLGAAGARMRTRLAVGAFVTLIPFVLLVALFSRSLQTFARTAEAARREERLRLLGEAASLIAHEVKNSLNGVRIGLDLLVRGDGATRTALHERIVGELRKQIERMSEFTTELLTFSKGIHPRPVAIDLEEFVRKVAAISADRASELGVGLSVVGFSRAVRVRADPSLVHIVVSNLVGNALDAVAAASAAGAPLVEVEIGAADGRAFVRVSDNGPGVRRDVKAKLFEPFVSGKPSGVGIGLALSRKIARAHGGDLVLERAERGAVFLLTLPMEAS